VPPKVEYDPTAWGKALCPALDALLEWAALRRSVRQIFRQVTRRDRAHRVSGLC